MGTKTLLNSMLLKAGDILECRYGYRIEIIDLLATGPFSDVYRVRNINDNRFYAMKIEKHDCFQLTKKKLFAYKIYLIILVEL